MIMSLYVILNAQLAAFRDIIFPKKKKKKKKNNGSK